MFLTEIRHKPRGLNKSWLITLISIVQNLGNSMLILIIPLYLYKVFKSEMILGEVSSFAALSGIVSTILLGYVLQKFERHYIFKVMTIVGIFGIFLLIITKTIFDVNLSRILARSVNIILPAILALYLKDLTTPEDYPHMQGIYSALVNMSWMGGPIIAGLLIEYFSTIKNSLSNILLINNFRFEYLEYTLTFGITIIFFLISLLIFIWGKFVIKHPHLQKNEKTESSNKSHHIIHISNFIEYFKNSNRSLAFINLSFIAIWWVLIYTFMPILLENHGMQTGIIGVVVGFISLPLVLFEGFLDKYLKIFGGNLNTLFVGYLIFAGFVIAAFIAGYNNIYLFAGLMIASSIGIAITEPMQELMYFEGTDKTNENIYYSIFGLGNSFFTLITPAIAGFTITKLGIDKAFSMVPFLFIGIIGILIYYKLMAEK